MRDSSDKVNKRAIVIDTSALVAGFDPFLISETQYTVPEVREEVTADTMSWVRFNAAIDSGKVELRTPKRTFAEQAKAFASAVGDSFFLSETDIQVLALALELKAEGFSPLIATDDYSIQNVATEMNIKFEPLSTFGIRRRLQWTRYCPACHKKYSPNYKSLRCEVCGTRLKRKPVRRNPGDH